MLKNLTRTLALALVALASVLVVEVPPASAASTSCDTELVIPTPDLGGAGL